jgi:hypothetical protein
MLAVDAVLEMQLTWMCGMPVSARLSGVVFGMELIE